jgi:hypothetical protein
MAHAVEYYQLTQQKPTTNWHHAQHCYININKEINLSIHNKTTASYLSVCTYIHTYIYTYVCMHICTYVCVCKYICMHAAYVRVCVLNMCETCYHLYINSHTHTQKTITKRGIFHFALKIYTQQNTAKCQIPF